MYVHLFNLSVQFVTVFTDLFAVCRIGSTQIENSIEIGVGRIEQSEKKIEEFA